MTTSMTSAILDILRAELPDSAVEKVAARIAVALNLPMPAKETMLWSGVSSTPEDMSRKRVWSLDIATDGSRFRADWRLDSAWVGEVPQWGSIYANNLRELISKLYEPPAEMGGVGPPPGEKRAFILSKIVGDWRKMVMTATEQLGVRS